MKKGIIIAVAVLVVLGIIGGAGWYVTQYGIPWMQPKGLIINGTKEQIEKSESMLSGKLDYTYKFTAKTVDDKDGQQILVIKQKDMEELCSNKYVYKVSNGSDTKAIDNSELKNTTPVYFGKTSTDTVALGNEQLKVTYGGDCILGNTRKYKAGYVMVSDSDYEKCTGKMSEFMAVKTKTGADDLMQGLVGEYIELVDIR